MRYRIVLAFSILFFIAACSEVTATPTPLPTVPPTPVESKVWEAPPVLVEYYPDYPADVEGSGTNSIPTIVLYATGQIIVKHTTYPSDYSSGAMSTTSIVTAQLSTGEVCSFFQQIINIGFFNPNVLNYYPWQGYDATTMSLTIHSWKSQHLAIYGLWEIANSTDHDSAGISAELTNTLAWLDRYTPPRSQPFVPDEITLEPLEWEPRPTDTVEDWPYKDISLATISSSYPALATFEGNKAREIYSEIGDTWAKFYQEGDRTYFVYVRPSIPLQKWDPSQEPHPQSYSYPTTPTRHMDCTGF